MIRITFLGTNGWYDTPTGNTPSVLIETPVANLILDAGMGLHKVTDYIDATKPTWLFLTHFHFDHIYGLHTLVKFRLEKGLDLVSYSGSTAIFKQLLDEPFTVPWHKLPYEVRFHEKGESEHDFPFGKVKILPLKHTGYCQGYRFEVEGKSIAYCSDTGVCDNVIELGKNADILITECAHLPGVEDGGWGHLNPREAATLAKKANASKLFLMHFNAYDYHSHEIRATALAEAVIYFPETQLARDGDQIRL